MESKKMVKDAFVEESESKNKAEEYIRVMTKITERGISFVEEEIDRLTTLLKSKKVSDKKRADFISRRNILHHFDFSLDHFNGETKATPQSEL